MKPEDMTIEDVITAEVIAETYRLKSTNKVEEFFTGMKSNKKPLKEKELLPYVALCIYNLNKYFNDIEMNDIYQRSEKYAAIRKGPQKSDALFNYYKMCYIVGFYDCYANDSCYKWGKNHLLDSIPESDKEQSIAENVAKGEIWNGECYVINEKEINDFKKRKTDAIRKALKILKSKGINNFTCDEIDEREEIYFSNNDCPDEGIYVSAFSCYSVSDMLDSILEEFEECLHCDLH